MDVYSVYLGPLPRNRTWAGCIPAGPEPGCKKHSVFLLPGSRRACSCSLGRCLCLLTRDILKQSEVFPRVCFLLGFSWYSSRTATTKIGPLPFSLLRASRSAATKKPLTFTFLKPISRLYLALNSLPYASVTSSIEIIWGNTTVMNQREAEGFKGVV